MKTVLAGMFREALTRLDLDRVMTAKVRLQGTGKVLLVAVGKAASEMAASFERIAGPGRARGIVVTASPPEEPLPNFQYIIGGHPYPNRESFEAANAVLSLVKGANQVVYLLSGGGSALLEKPLFDDISLDDASSFHRALVTCGASIYEMNVVRKHYSAVKGGRLAVAAHPARQTTFYVSDVPAGRPSTVASGPTMPDESTIAECEEIIARYRLPLPQSYRRPYPETPKPGDLVFKGSQYVELLSNQDGIHALLDLARGQGWTAEADASCDDWPLEKAADYLLAKVRATAERPYCLVSGGELSSPVTSDGIGGRNQAFVLYCAMKAANERIVVLSGGTDGIDGNSPAAGAVSDGDTAKRAAAAGLDPLSFYKRCDSHSFFSALGDTIMTGPTGNNVRDLRLLVAY